MHLAFMWPRWWLTDSFSYTCHVFLSFFEACHLLPLTLALAFLMQSTARFIAYIPMYLTLHTLVPRTSAFFSFQLSTCVYLHKTTPPIQSPCMLHSESGLVSKRP